MNHVDVVFDTHRKNSWRETRRNKRGKFIRKKVTENTQLLKTWVLFLRNDENIDELGCCITQSSICKTWHEFILCMKWRNFLHTELQVTTYDTLNLRRIRRSSVFAYQQYRFQEKGIQEVKLQTVNTDAVTLIK